MIILRHEGQRDVPGGAANALANHAVAVTVFERDVLRTGAVTVGAPDAESAVSLREPDAALTYDVPALDGDGKPVGETTRTVVREETLNSMKAIWARNKAEVSEDEYKEFYTHISHDWNPPLKHLHVKLEGTTEYTALLYLPSKAPFDLFQPEHKHGVHLYSRRVFIMDDCKELLPEYFGFVKGVVDAPDLNLNISREILQQDRLVLNIRKNLVKKLFEMLKGLDVTPKPFEKTTGVDIGEPFGTIDLAGGILEGDQLSFELAGVPIEPGANQPETTATTDRHAIEGEATEPAEVRLG